MRNGSPDYTRLVKGVAEIVVGYGLATVALAVMSLLVGASRLILGMGVLVLTAMCLVAVIWYCVSWTRSDSRRRRVAGAPHVGQTSTPQARRRLDVISIPGIALTAIVILSVPVAMIGAALADAGLVTAGVVLLVVALLDLSVAWPIRRGRSANRR